MRNVSRRARLTLLPLTVALLAASLAGPGVAAAAAPHDGYSGSGSVITVTTTSVGAPGNPAVAVVPFTDAVYRSCAQAPTSSRGCLEVGRVGYPYQIGQVEVTVEQWVAFLNTADATGRDPHNLYDVTESSTAWPRFGQINFAPRAAVGHHYSVAYPQWADKPYGFATFLRAARFVNSLGNGRVLATHTRTAGPFRYTSYQVKLSPNTETGMYDLARRVPARAKNTGFVLPSQNEWIKAAYYDPRHGAYWKYPTNAGVFGDGDDTAPAPTVLNPSTGDVTNGTTQPLASYHASGKPAPAWCPGQLSSDACTGNPLGLDPTTYAQVYQGSLSTVGQARTRSPWGTLDQGGNAVEWTDTVAAPPAGQDGARVWRRLHGGISNAPAFQMWPSAVGLQPQDNAFFAHSYPWLGIRIGVLNS